MNREQLRKMALASLLIALGIILPFITGNLVFLGNRFLPMHIPVMLCGILCGKKYGLLVGLITPVLRSFLIGIPPLFPIAVVMSLELAAYGFFIGLFYSFLSKKMVNIIISLILAMIIGRLIWGFSAYKIYPLAGIPFTIDIFFAGAFINAIPGIIFQVIFIPVFIQGLIRANLIPSYEVE